MPFARSLPRSCRTVGELARVTLARNYATIAKRVGGSSPADVLLSLRYWIAAEIGKDVKWVKPETPFPEGLNIY